MKRISLLVMAFMVLFSCSAFAETSEWEFVTSTKLSSVYFSNKNLNFDSENNIDFDERTVFTEAGINDFFNNCSEGEQSKYKNISYIEKFRSLNGSKIKTNLLIIYDKNDRIIDISNKEQPWYEVQAGTVEASTVYKVAQYALAHYDEIMNRTE